MTNCPMCLKPIDCDCPCDICEFNRGIWDAQHSSLSDICRHRSQGDTPWDRGWNAWIAIVEKERDKQ